MSSISKINTRIIPAMMNHVRVMSGKAGAINEAGGSFAERERLQETDYFLKKQREQLSKLKEHLHDEIHFHEEQIKRHQEAIKRHKERAASVDKQ